MTERNSLSMQAPAISVLADLAQQCPNLPGAYINFSHVFPQRVDVLLDGPVDLEAWRAALHVAPDAVMATMRDEQQRLVFDAIVQDVSFHVWTSFELAKSEAEGVPA